MPARLTAVCLTAACLLTPPALADPVAAPGDLRLRHDLQMLGDAGLLNIPLTTWPIPWGDISNALADKNKVHNSALRASWQRVHQRMEHEFSSRVKASSRLAAVGLPARFRTFTDTPRSSAEAGMTASMTGDYLAVHLEGTAAVRIYSTVHWAVVMLLTNITFTAAATVIMIRVWVIPLMVMVYPFHWAVCLSIRRGDRGKWYSGRSEPTVTASVSES